MPDLGVDGSRLWFVYLIEAESGAFYCGVTTDLKRRFEQHCSGKGAKFFRRSPPKRIVYYESFSTQAQALKREYRVKRLSREEKIALVEQFETSAVSNFKKN